MIADTVPLLGLCSEQKSMLSKQKLAIAAFSSLAVFCKTTVFQSSLAWAIEVPTTPTSISKAPYSQVFFTGSAYAVKDHDFKGDNRSIGFSTVWIENPTKGKFQVGVRYCLPDTSLADSGISLTSLVLMNKNQPLVTIDQSIKTTSAQQKEISPSYYINGLGDPFWENSAFYGGIDPFWEDWDDLDDLGDASPTYVPAATCSAGGSRFDISKLASAIAKLPPQTLQVKLVFSNGATSDWRLGEKTVQALKDLLTIDQTPTNSPKPPSNN